MSVKEYIEVHGYKVSDLTKKELKEVEKEVRDMNEGVVVMDGFFSPTGVFARRMLKERD